MNKILKIIIGIILVVLPILFAVFDWLNINLGTATLNFIKGFVVLLIILIGIMFVVMAATE
mgnify:CR=1 FL=1